MDSDPGKAQTGARSDPFYLMEMNAKESGETEKTRLIRSEHGCPLAEFGGIALSG